MHTYYLAGNKIPLNLQGRITFNPLQPTGHLSIGHRPSCLWTISATFELNHCNGLYACMI